jgi:Bacterial membrane protein YfhO
VSAKKKSDPAKVNDLIPDSAASPVNDFFDNLGNKTPLLVFGLIFIVGFIVFKDYLLFDKAYYFNDMGSDSENYLYPNLLNASNYISKYGMPKWSFNFGMGQNIFPFFLRDPFDIFLYIAGKNHINYGTIYKEFAKILLGGLVFYYYLKTLNLSNFTRSVGTLFYAFCGFTILGSGWQIFTFEAFNMALLLLAFELLYSRQKWWLFPIAIFLICISQPVNLYIYGILLITYTLLRHIHDNKFNVKNLTGIFLKMAGLGFLGMLLGAPLMIEIIYQILESPRGSGVNSYASILKATPTFSMAEPLQMGTSVMRFFSNDILGSGSDFKGWTNYLEAPLFYCGLPCLLLMPQVFQFLEKRIRIAFILFLSIWMMPIIFPYFRRAFWLFTGDYYRAYSFFVAFFFIYYSIFALDQIIKKHKINLIILVVTVVVLFGLLHYPFFDDDIIVPTVSVFVTIMLIVYGALLFFMSKKDSPVYLKYIFLFAVIFELCFLCGITVNDRKAVTTEDIAARKGYNDNTVEALDYLKSVDNSFYRIDKTYASSKAMHFSINDAQAQGYRGTSGYSPFNQQYYISYLQLMGISNKNVEIESRWALGLTSRPILEAQNRVKYMLAKTQINPIWSVVCDLIKTTGDVKIYRSKFVLPVGFTYDHYIRESVFENLIMSQKDFTTLKACVIKDTDINKVAGLNEFQLRDTISQPAFSVPLYKQLIDELSRDTLALTKFDETNLTGNITATADKMMYITIPYDAGWTLKVDGKETDKIILDGGMTGVMLKKGTHAIEMTYELRFFKTGLYLCLLGLLLYGGLWFYLKKRSAKEQTL